jgi:mono/diheme cytochrome c family protein
MSNFSKYLNVLCRGFFIACALMILPLSATGSDFSAGKAVYKKANCMGCHKWHGKGGGGYGGVASSLRDSPLDEEALALVIRCGRPGSGMPYHKRKAYRGENRECYASTREELGNAMPARARYFLKESEIDDVVNYVSNQIQRRGEPGHSDCVAFWGADAKRCQMMAQ